MKSKPLLSLALVLSGGLFGIFSIGFSQVETVRNYIARQEEHHRKVSF